MKAKVLIHQLPRKTKRRFYTHHLLTIYEALKLVSERNDEGKIARVFHMRITGDTFRVRQFVLYLEDHGLIYLVKDTLGFSSITLTRKGFIVLEKLEALNRLVPLRSI